MKLLLTSAGLANITIINALRDLTVQPFAQLNLAFIPTAANVEPGDKRWLIDDLETCKKLGFKAIDIVDISALPQKVWQPRLNDAQVIMVEGGNNYHLIYWFRKSGLADLMAELLTEKVYVGISAGSMLMPAKVLAFGNERKEAEAVGDPIDEKGLAFVNFYLEPHINSAYFPNRDFEFAASIAKHIKQPLYALDDQSAIKVVDSEITVVSEGKWRKFN